MKRTVTILFVRPSSLFLYLDSLPTKEFGNWLGKSANDNIDTSRPTPTSRRPGLPCCVKLRNSLHVVHYYLLSLTPDRSLPS